MKNGKTCLSHRFRSLSNRAFICACLIACLYVVGCRSSRNTVEETQREVHAVVKETFATDTVYTAATSCETQTDTAAVRADERAVISLKRDSAGRVVEIRTERSAKVNANVSRKTDRDRWFYGLNATRYSEASGSVDSVTKKKEEIAKEVNVGIPLECLIGWSIVALLILFYTGDYIYRIWKRKRKE